ncbi:N-6 adenine specific DNA methyltransferase [Candidatus Phytoplasma mali]|uniref:site-specific DNA-methyltransferase (adenine-specific) n=1 Tax=Phytoplasma mali (strain AT) TaxID=482235 RepID=B3QZR2_PHYMT|nr:N-6 DNA methylase [Candidatus Phytoplasma mali]CAP18449.1 N-6 adenine specific DNA methyltransferase [Candidatus Phytoplasma mali]
MENKHKLTHFYIKNNSIIELKDKLSISEILKNDDEYLQLFKNNKFELDTIIKQSAKTARIINIQLRPLEVQYRPILISILLICLKNTKFKEEFDNQKNNRYSYDSKLKANQRKIEYECAYDSLLQDINIAITNVLLNQNINDEKIKYLHEQMCLIKSLLGDNGLEIIKDVLEELKTNIYHLLDSKNKYSYDIIGNFYEVFLKYAGVTNVKNGIVLTPRHITELFTKLIDISSTDVVLDPCCGTGGFLIAGMNSIIDKLDNKNEKEINKIKQNQIIGFDKDPTMYTLSISNMLFRGDGKSQIYNLDFFSEEVDKKIKEGTKKPTIGFINPPYAGKSTPINPTKKEIEFLEKLLKLVDGRVVMIAPLSTYINDNPIRNRILKKHTLEKIIQMPKKIFEPNASTHTAISIFKTNIPHNNKEVDFYNLEDDGLVLFKNKGRVDRFHKWGDIEKDFLNKFHSKYYDGYNYLKHQIKENDEWISFAYVKTNYNHLTEKDFLLTIKKYVIFQIKKDLGILNKNFDEITLLEKLNQKIVFTPKKSNITKNSYFDIFKNCKSFQIKDLFKVKGTKTTSKEEIEEYEKGEYAYISTRATNNGVNGFYSFYSEEGNVLTVDSAVIGSCFYQENKFTATDHVEQLKPNFKLNKYIAMFLTTIINQEQFRYSYGRGFNQKRIKKTIIKLPTNKAGTPDWELMENYIKTLPYSKNL